METGAEDEVMPSFLTECIAVMGSEARLEVLFMVMAVECVIGGFCNDGRPLMNFVFVSLAFIVDGVVVFVVVIVIAAVAAAAAACCLLPLVANSGG